jgi:(p)ppGpp synthase/HD superfamily hydrolase
MTTALSEAITIATAAHDGQVDKAGQPYILHPLRVMGAMTTDLDRIAAVLHDVVEDSEDWQLSDLTAFGSDIVEAIDALTRREGEDYFHYIMRLAHNPRAVRVKLADLRDNMDTKRLGELSAADVSRMRRYRKAREMLQTVNAYL